MSKYKIAIIGAGNMGAAIAKGLDAERYSVVVSNPHRAKLDVLAAECPGICTSTDNTEAVHAADLVILAVKPYVLPDVVAQVKDVVAESAIVASLAAPVSLSDLSVMLGGGKRGLLKVIPNTAISVGESMTFISALNVDDSALATPIEIFSGMGKVSVIPERLMPAATALCSCGIAYAFRYIRAAVEGAVELGIRPADALAYEIETLKGACRLLEVNDAHPESEIDKVTTPGGITIRGLNAMERFGFTTSVIEGLKASMV